MVTIHIDEQTASALEAQAEAAGMSLTEYLRTLVRPAAENGRPDWTVLERGFEDLSFEGPSLPDDFSRADIYIDHD